MKNFKKKKYLLLLLYILTILIFIWHLLNSINIKTDYFSNNKNYISETKNKINLISNKLHSKNYWLTWWHWWELLAHTFYWYSLVNLYLQNKEDIEFKKFAIKELKFIYYYIQNEWKNNFLDKWTKIKYWIIYQWHKNQILASLIMLWENEFKDEFYKNSENLRNELLKSKMYTWETYKWRAWYVDNVNAFYSLFLCDKIREKDWLKPINWELISNWVNVMKNNKDKKWMILTETYSPNIENNQARWPAIVWLTMYLKEIDFKLYQEQLILIDKYFIEKFWYFNLITDIPKWEKQINKVWAWPVVFWYSSSATTLWLALYKISDKNKFYNLLKTLNFLFFYNWEEYIFWKSTLINSLIIWWETNTTWADKL